MPQPAFERKLCPRVLANGCVEILHRSHLTYLAEARALGASKASSARRTSWTGTGSGHSIPFLHHPSTTKLLDKIRS
jgi:bifunctional ADP-heptose synthase (sugar kinase/adenylyltransferase)